MADYRDTLHKVIHPDGRELIGGTFRGVPFFVASSDRSGGRRLVTHEFPFRDDPSIDDLGRKSRVFGMECYVLGAAYVRQRDDLLEAIEDKAGDGELVHPFYGVMRAACGTYSVRESIIDGGIATFQLSFREAPTVAIPSDRPDLVAAVDTAADDAVLANKLELTNTITTTAQPGFALDSIESELSAASTSLKSELSPLTDVIQDTALISARVDLIVANTSSLIRTPNDMIDDLIEVIGTLAGTLLTAPRSVLQALLDVYAAIGAVPTAIGDTATRVLERTNQSAMTAALKRVMVVEAARLIAVVDYETEEDAVADSAAVVALLDEQQAIAGNDAYPALVMLGAAVRRAVPGDSNLASVITVERLQPVPALVLSFQLYGNIDSEADLIARNPGQHSGVLNGSLKALSSV